MLHVWRSYTSRKHFRFDFGSPNKKAVCDDAAAKNKLAICIGATALPQPPFAFGIPCQFPPKSHRSEELVIRIAGEQSKQQVFVWVSLDSFGLPFPAIDEQLMFLFSPGFLGLLFSAVFGLFAFPRTEGQPERHSNRLRCARRSVPASVPATISSAISFFEFFGSVSMAHFGCTKVGHSTATTGDTLRWSNNPLQGYKNKNSNGRKTMRK